MTTLGGLLKTCKHIYGKPRPFQFKTERKQEKPHAQRNPRWLQGRKKKEKQKMNVQESTVQILDKYKGPVQLMFSSPRYKKKSTDVEKVSVQCMFSLFNLA